MKKNLILFFAVAMGFASCGGDDDQTPTPNKGSKLTKFVVTRISKSENTNNKAIISFTLEYGKNGYIRKLTNTWKENNYSGNSELLFTYNEKDQLIKEEKFVYEKDYKQKENEEIIIYKYNEKGLIISAIDTDKLSHTNNYFYNEKKQLIKEKQGSTTTFEYDKNGKLSKKTFGNNDISTFTFDDKKNPLSALFPKEYTLINPIYFAPNNILTMSDENGKSIYTYTYNEQGFPIKATEKAYSSDNRLEDTITTEYFYE